MKDKGWRFSKTGDVEVSIKEITPAMAAEALLANVNNRRVSDPLVRKYTHAMRSGHWFVTNQGIGFYEDGTGADLQHRMKAIIAYGKPVKMEVTVGIPKAAAFAIDAHRPRSIADRLKIGGVDQDSLPSKVSIINAILNATQPSTAFDGVDANDMADLLAACENELDSVIDLTRSKAKGMGHASYRAGLVSGLLHGAVDKDALARFTKLVAQGTDAAAHESAAIRLREYLLTRPDGTGRSERKQIFLRTQRALKAFIEKHAISRLYAPETPVWDCAFLFSEEQKQEAA
jgi:hypothetical protein